MAKLHMKGYILRLLNEHQTGLWDYQICQAVLGYYQHQGPYWIGEVRATLTDLLSGAMIVEMEDKLDTEAYFGIDKVMVKFNLSRFGAQRMRETGLL